MVVQDVIPTEGWVEGWVGSFIVAFYSACAAGALQIELGVFAFWYLSAPPILHRARSFPAARRHLAALDYDNSDRSHFYNGGTVSKPALKICSGLNPTNPVEATVP